MKITQLASGGGCGCKLAPHILHRLLQQSGVMETSSDALLTDAKLSDDAAVWKISEEIAIVSTIDFFSPIVDDAKDFGQIAATNAISDIYAMGATPLFALAVAAMPQDVLSEETIAAIFSGGRIACQRAGITVAGGHTIAAKELLYGLAVTGSVNPKHVLTNAKARTGDALLLSKPLGIGVLSAANKKELLEKVEYEQWISTMTKLNTAGAELSKIADIHGLTDVTGFGLLGHLAEMCHASALGAELLFSSIPLLPAAVKFAQAGFTTGAQKNNWQSVKSVVDYEGNVLDWQHILLTDPQTSGGLLLTCNENAISIVQDVFHKHGQTISHIGYMTDNGRINVKI